ncbi:hypothetical protein CHU98_g9493 [Xylaria longipes]|nr:hypothetical protein CHU98_g9493 [Xylaria longipes]
MTTFGVNKALALYLVSFPQVISSRPIHKAWDLDASRQMLRGFADDHDDLLWNDASISWKLIHPMTKKAGSHNIRERRPPLLGVAQLGCRYQLWVSIAAPRHTADRRPPTGSKSSANTCACILQSPLTSRGLGMRQAIFRSQGCLGGTQTPLDELAQSGLVARACQLSRPPVHHLQRSFQKFSPAKRSMCMGPDADCTYRLSRDSP